MGRALLRNDIFELIGIAREAGIMPAKGTNGTLLTKEVARELLQAGLWVWQSV